MDMAQDVLIALAACALAVRVLSVKLGAYVLPSAGGQDVAIVVKGSPK